MYGLSQDSVMAIIMWESDIVCLKYLYFQYWALWALRVIPCMFKRNREVLEYVNILEVDED